MIKVAIVGGRDFTDKNLMRIELNKTLRELRHFDIDLKDVEFISGGAPGTDTLAEEVAEEFDIPFKEYRSDWSNLEAKPCVIKTNLFGKKYNALAGHNRNQLMAEDADFVVAFWDGVSTGTQDMIQRSGKEGCGVRIVYY